MWHTTSSPTWATVQYSTWKISLTDHNASDVKYNKASIENILLLLLFFILQLHFKMCTCLVIYIYLFNKYSDISHLYSPCAFISKRIFPISNGLVRILCHKVWWLHAFDFICFQVNCSTTWATSCKLFVIWLFLCISVYKFSCQSVLIILHNNNNNFTTFGAKTVFIR